ncbi:MAG TPA: PPOX class F420-dependent oxidoreductase [Candidatus Dormibacteraeota bacterium]|jgi:PPOX class probable F420-dependent enzyme|nr:PPOX class F420-dependent oxidoreductase [Candidatus Dormibacteraeota bacterium]
MSDTTQPTPAKVPAEYLDLLERPVLASLATTGPKGQPQVNPMWFEWDGQRVRFTHTSYRQKYRNLQRDPRAAISIYDPENPYRYLELRGVVEEIVPDPTGSFYQQLSRRYGGDGAAPADAEQRVVLVFRPDSFTKQ